MIHSSVHQPISVAVGVLLSVFAGLLAVSRVPIRMTPEVESVVVSVMTNWESASAEEIESDIVEEQEKVLGEVTGLRSMISTSAAGQGTIRLEFETGTDIEDAKAEVLQKLDEVPGYPGGVLQPVVEGVDPESVDYISWMGLASTDPEFDSGTLADFMERRLKPRFERLPGISQVGIRGARQSELHIIVDPRAMAARGVTFSQLRQAIESANVDISAGRLEEGKRDIRVRTIGRFEGPEDIARMVIYRDESGPVYLGDISEVRESFKERTDWARARGHQMPFFNFQLARGANLLETMGFLMEEVDALNAPGGLLEQKAKELGINGTLELINTYDSTTYVRDAIDLVQSNILVGGVLATLTLLLFLRSFRSVGIIAVAIPVSVIASFVVLIALGRSINIISLAGLAFAVGMVVDNAIVVIENIYRHLEMGKNPAEAALDGAKEVAGAVVASTMTTLVVFFPILLIQETAGQLFRDIALAIMAAVGLSMVVSLTLIPSAAARFLRRGDADSEIGEEEDSGAAATFGPKKWLLAAIHPFAKFLHRLPEDISRIIGVVTVSWPRRIALFLVFGTVTVLGTAILLPPRDYLPTGNRDVVFGMLFPPPGYNLDQLSEMGRRIEERVRPSWEVTENKFKIEDVVEKREGRSTEPQDTREPVPLGYGQEGTVMPPPLRHYFLVSFEGRMFHGAMSDDKKRTIDAVPLLNMATSGAAAPDTISFAFQFPLFRVAGTTGSAIQIDLTGDDLDQVSGAAGALFGALMGEFGPGAARPEPPNFALPLHELQVVPKDERLRELGMTRADLGLAVQANGDGILLFRQFEQNGELKDMKILSQYSRTDDAMEALMHAPIATPLGGVVDFDSVAELRRVRGPDMIRHVDRLRAVTVELTPPRGQPLEVTIEKVEEKIAQLREAGAIPPSVGVELSGSAGKLAEITEALLGDGSLFGTVSSTLVMAFLVVYLLMVVLFQSWTYPLVIMLSVPLATFGGFLGLALVHWWSVADRYSPVQNLDMLSILGFVILAGVVVNNAILIVHQTLNFLRDDPDLDPQTAIRESVKSRVRPILMSTLTSVGGMLPLVLLPGAGSELYRGLGAVVVGGLLVSTIFTLFLVPTVLSAMFAVRGEDKVREMTRGDETEPHESATPASVAIPVIIGALLTMTSCVPESDLTAAIDGGAAYGEGGSGASAMPEPGDWWKAFDDSGLDALMERLRRDNPGLKASQARYDQARAALGLARSDQVPRLYGDASALRVRDSAGGIFVPPDLTYNDYRAALNLSYEIDLWGRVRQSVDAARAEMEASAADLAGAQVSLEAELARTWYQWRFVDEEAKVLARTIELREENLKLVEARVRGGETNELDLERARAELETTRAQSLQIGRSRAELTHALAVLTGEAPATFQAPKPGGAGVGKAAVIPAGVPSDLLARRPDIASAERRLAAAASRVGAAKASYLPKITLTGVGGSSTLKSSQFFDFDSLFGQIGPQVQIPIFQGGKLIDEVKKADAEAREALAAYEEVVLVAFREVEDALSGIRFLDREIEAHRKAVEAAKAAATLSRRRYEGGLVSYLEVVDAERTALSEERELTRARSARHLASVQLIRALGGGWEKP